ncbi:hypothetical protein WJX79_010357 [Trebouxia sp. C0005]|nr:MAG: radical SAM domain-containing [Trebouxia sp. A1-2]
MVGRPLSRHSSVWDKAAVAAAFQEAGVKPSHLTRLYKHLAKHPEAAWEEVPNLPKAAAHLLNEKFHHLTSTVLHCQTSASADTTKLLLKLQNGMQVEAVIMHYDTTASAREECNETASDDVASTSGRCHVAGHQRATLCVSSQVGCIMGCTFCATGSMGIKGDLTAGEIVEQLVHAQRVTPVRNVVFMGMGEPLNNYNEVSSAVKMMVDPQVFALRRSAVTVSTVGVIPRMLQMMEDLPGVSLALSLHAPTQELRKTIVPSAKSYPLEKLMAAVDKYQMQTRQKVFVEYVMLAKVNDNEEQAHQLGALLQGRAVVLNLIPWNPVYSPEFDFEAPGHQRTAAFQTIVRQYGVHCTVRQEKGQDISGACGQLVVEYGAGKGCGSSTNSDMEDIASTLIGTK